MGSCRPCGHPAGDINGSQEFGYHSRLPEAATSTPSRFGEDLSLPPYNATRALLSCRQNSLPTEPHPGRGRQTPHTD